MKQEDFKLICVHDKESDTYCVWPAKMPGIIVQVNNLNDAPKAIAKSFECLLTYGFKEGIHEIIEFDLKPNSPA